ncbi:cutinase family protein [Mycobacterium sp. EPa45]|uniref:cutinase family protein n=1 Tax=Mycobacterium sp. EPa45 TaxID=1545728 RepID=UPI000641B872|nr:cutinase family protein [Mycobacterium sp. EPa45]AKK25531.1 cutinase [Mycobacterium sp. EPa45]
MTLRHLPRLLGAATVSASAILCGTVVPAASAAPCSDVEVVFARGTGEQPGVGGVGQSFVDALRAQLGPRSLNVYAVNYAASNDFNDREGLARTVIDGVRDADNHIEATAANCPNTRIVLGGYSQGAALAAYVTADRAPAGVPASAVPAAVPASAANHVASVALFGTPSPEFLAQYDAPQLTIGSNFATKTLQLCAQGDTICDGTPSGGPTVAHASYGFNGMTAQAASYAVDRIAPVPVAAASGPPNG